MADKIEIAIPCYNEEATVVKVVSDFREAIPNADIVVYDNNSSDATAERALQAGARVARVNQQGKGHVVEAIFETTDADVVIMVDGDDTYEAQDVVKLIEELEEDGADMVIGTRLQNGTGEFRPMHYFGNRLLTRTLNLIFGTRHRDILSGYRAFSRRFIENVPVLSNGFEVETELMVQALENGMGVAEIPIRFRDRPEGSVSKLRTIRDGYRIIVMMVTLFRDHRPLFAFSIAGLVSALAGAPLWLLGFLYGEQSKLFTLFRNVGATMIMLTLGLFLVGLILNTINTRFRELQTLAKRKRL
ncbi:MAG: glycosyltransferase [bacterium]